MANKQLPDHFTRPYLESIIAAVFAEALHDETEIFSLARKTADLITDYQVQYFFL